MGHKIFTLQTCILYPYILFSSKQHCCKQSKYFSISLIDHCVRGTHSSSRSRNPRSTFCNLIVIFCFTAPSIREIMLSLVSVFSLLASHFPSCVFSFCADCSASLAAETRGRMSISACPMKSSVVNVSLSYTSCKHKPNKVLIRHGVLPNLLIFFVTFVRSRG